MALVPGYHRVAPVVRPCHIVLLLVSVITGIYGRGLSALNPAPNLKDQGTTLVQSLSLDLFSMGGPNRSQRLQLTYFDMMGH